MKIQPKTPSTNGPAEMFSGDVWFDVIAKGDEPSCLRVNIVRFAPGAYTAWHSHARGQTLHVTEGFGLVQSRGGEVTEIRPGDTIYTPPGEWHWHGAAPDHFMSHLAMREANNDAAEPEPPGANTSPSTRPPKGQVSGRVPSSMALHEMISRSTQAIVLSTDDSAIRVA